MMTESEVQEIGVNATNRQPPSRTSRGGGSMSTAGSAIRGALRRHRAPIRDLRAGRPIRTGLIAARYYTRRESRLQNAEASIGQERGHGQGAD
jgi:hypothetical protein